MSIDPARVPPPGMHALRLVHKEVRCKCGGTVWESKPLVVILVNALAATAAEGTKIQPIGTRFKCPNLNCDCYATVTPRGEWKIQSASGPDLPEEEQKGGGNILLPS